MIEPIMFFGLGFLAASLLGLIIVPFVHGRAVRLTVRRLEAATPLSMAEIQADKDQLRAEFAMSTRRLEMSVEQLKTKTTSQLAEIGKKGAGITRLKGAAARRVRDVDGAAGNERRAAQNEDHEPAARDRQEGRRHHPPQGRDRREGRSEEHTSELQSRFGISYA